MSQTLPDSVRSRGLPIAGVIVDGVGSRPEPYALRPSGMAAPTKSLNSGCGRSGRLLNSGWNWPATNQG